MWDLWWTKLHWGQVLSEYFGYLCQFLFHRLLHTHHHHHLSSGAGTIGQLVVFVQNELSLTPLQENKRNLKKTGV
jgi:hypothetical protein